jgi:oligopeptide transport system substrate-binding protein
MRLLIPLLILIALLVASFWLDQPPPPAELTVHNPVAIRTLDPQRMSWNHDIRLGYALFEGLLSYEAQSFELRPGVAERWSFSDGYRRCVFHLRRDAKWSDGSPVTAEDFVYAWRMGLMPENAADYTDWLLHLKGGAAFFEWATQSLDKIGEALQQDRRTGLAMAEQRREQVAAQFRRLVSVRTPGPWTIEVELEQPLPYFLHLVAFPTWFPLPRDVIEPNSRIDQRTGVIQRDAQWTKPPEIVSNGPYELVEWRFKQYVTLRRNPYYWDADNVAIGSIRAVDIEDYNTTFIAYESGALDLVLGASPMPFAPDLLDAAAAGRRNDVHASDWFGTYFFYFNCDPHLPDGRVNPLADYRVRQALAMSVDKRAIVEQVTRLRQTVAGSLIPPGSLGEYQPPTGLGYDPQEARRLLAKAGYPQGRGLPELEVLYNSGGGHEKTAQAIARMWETELGLRIDPLGQELKVFHDRIRRRDYTIARGSWIGDYADPTTFLDLFISGHSNNRSGFTDQVFDSLMKKAAETIDIGARRELLEQAEARLMTRQPILPVYHYRIVYLFDPQKIRGVSFHPRGQQFFGQMEVTD